MVLEPVASIVRMGLVAFKSALQIPAIALSAVITNFLAVVGMKFFLFQDLALSVSVHL